MTTAARQDSTVNLAVVLPEGVVDYRASSSNPPVIRRVSISGAATYRYTVACDTEFKDFFLIGR